MPTTRRLSNAGTQPLVQTAYVKDVKAATTDGGTFTSGAWRTRDLTTLENPFNVTWISLAANQFTLQAGTYEIDGEAPARAVDSHKTKIRNITASTDDIIGAEANTGSAVAAENRSRVMGILTVTGPTVFELQHQCTTTKATNGFGSNGGFSVSEVYSMVKITKIR